MRLKWIGLVSCLLLATLVSCKNVETEDKSKAAEGQHDLIGVNKDTTQSFARNANPEAQWFPQAGLGLFIHWGISSVHGNLDISWAMIKNTPWDMSLEGRNKVTPEEYYKLAEQFNPEHYNPDQWLKAAADAGFKYAVLTTRHHDGYALWPSKYGELGTRTHLNGRDLLEPYVQACRKHGLKVGFYYSPPDWYFNRDYMSFGWETKGTDASPHLGMKHEPRKLPDKPAVWEQQYRDYVHGQVEELLTRYGKIDVLWFDGSVPGAISIERIRELQPGIVINDRQHGVGDYGTASFEYKLPESKPAGWWEYCDSVVGAWGYTKPEQCQPVNDIMNKYEKIQALGGNYLMNFAPRPNGEMPDCYYERMAEIKAWLKNNSK